MDRLETLAIFVAVAERSSFAEAARRLRKSPAAITRAVAELEESLGRRLLNRTTRSVSLTAAGAQYLEASRRVVGAHDDLLRTEVGGAGRTRGSLAVTAPTVFGRLHVVPCSGLSSLRTRSSTWSWSSSTAWSCWSRRASTWGSGSAFCPTPRWSRRAWAR